MDTASKFFTGLVIGSGVTVGGLLAAGAGSLVYSSVKVQNDNKALESCIHAFYADKLNGIREGSPTKTFLTCMEAQNKEVFKAIEEQYKNSLDRGN